MTHQTLQVQETDKIAQFVTFDASILFTIEQDEDSPTAHKFFENVGDPSDIKEASEDSDKAVANTPVALYRQENMSFISTLGGGTENGHRVPGLEQLCM